MVDATYGPKVYRKLGGDELVVASGGTLTVESGGTLNFSGTQTFDDIVGNDTSLDITGAAAADATSAGGAVAVAGAAGGATSGAGGAVSLSLAVSA
jgi:hypothetical protein